MKLNKYLVIYLSISFILCWGIGFIYVFFGEYVTPITGELTLTHPIAIIALYSPSVAGLIVYFTLDGMAGIKGILSKVIPRKQDLFWFPLLFSVMVLFALSMHYGSVLFGFGVPKITLTVPEMIAKGLLNFFMEFGLIGGVFGWIGFLLPYFQKKFKSNIPSALLTGLIFGLWVVPGYLISSLGTSTDFIFYVIQLMTFILFMSYIFNATEGNLLIYLFTFWLAATGSQIDLYYFNSKVQILQIVFFSLSALIAHMVYKKKIIKQSLQTFPEYVSEKIVERKSSKVS